MPYDSKATLHPEQQLVLEPKRPSQSGKGGRVYIGSYAVTPKLRLAGSFGSNLLGAGYTSGTLSSR